MEKIIGSDGGAVILGDISLTIPPGTFRENQTIRISIMEEVPDNYIFPPDYPVYQIDGIPLDLSSPIEVNIKHGFCL